jgi:SAM-dependent methyltransferase
MSYEKSARFYDLFDQKENFRFFLKYAAHAEEVLDIGAGTGRIALYLAEHGVRVCCVEPSPGMRAEFEKKLAVRPELSSRIQLIAGDAASFRANRIYPLALLSGSYDHFVNPEQQKKSLENIGSHLTTGGVLVFDVYLGLMGGRPLSPAGEAIIGDTTIKRYVGARVLSPEIQEVELIYELFKDGEMVDRIEEHGRVGITDRKRLHWTLENVGFEVMKEWGGYDFTPYKEGDSLIVIEAIKHKQFS